MNSQDFLSLLISDNSLHLIDYRQHLFDAGFDGTRIPSNEECIMALPPAEEPEPIKRRVTIYKDMYPGDIVSVENLLIWVAVILLIIFISVILIYVNYGF